MILHNAAGIAMVLLAMAAAQGRGTDMGATGQGGAGAAAAAHAAPITMDQRGDAATQDAAIDPMSSEYMVVDSESIPRGLTVALYYPKKLCSQGLKHDGRHARQACGGTPGSLK
jgi:hypothetical protein